MQVEASPFDSAQYGLNIGRVAAEPEHSLADLELALSLARPHFDVVFLRTHQDSQLDRDLRNRGDIPADVLVTSALTDRPAVVPPRNTRWAIEAVDRVTDEVDLAAIEAISASVLRRSHLHADPRLPVDRTRHYYAAWARNNAIGRAQQTLLARADGQVIGYLSALIRNAIVDRRVVIDLIAVSAEWQGHGVGGGLLAALAEVIAHYPGAVATVGTQADNPALKLYRRYGYAPTERHATYHFWPPPAVPLGDIR